VDSGLLAGCRRRKYLSWWVVAYYLFCVFCGFLLLHELYPSLPPSPEERLFLAWPYLPTMPSFVLACREGRKIGIEGRMAHRMKSKKVKKAWRRRRRKEEGRKNQRKMLA
jgi:hypothetical protein